jgi:hypothetical protein
VTIGGHLAEEDQTLGNLYEALPWSMVFRNMVTAAPALSILGILIW